MACKKSLRIVNKDASKTKFIISFAKFVLICYYMVLLLGLSKRALVGESGVFPS
jgi:hypothetical protein